MKTSELTGVFLDYWVACAGGQLRMIAGTMEEKLGGYSPSTKWAEGGPIIDREFITVTPQCYPGPAGGDRKGWKATIVLYGVFEDHNGREAAKKYFGKTYLEAAMRAYVASRFGDEVPDTPAGEQ